MALELMVCCEGGHDGWYDTHVPGCIHTIPDGAHQTCPKPQQEAVGVALVLLPDLQVVVAMVLQCLRWLLLVVHLVDVGAFPHVCVDMHIVWLTLAFMCTSFIKCSTMYKQRTDM